jgi:hypothetical protein
MQALKQAARENDETRLAALCETWSLSTVSPLDADQNAAPEVSRLDGENPETGKAEDAQVNETSVAGRP